MRQRRTRRPFWPKALFLLFLAAGVALGIHGYTKKKQSNWRGPEKYVLASVERRDIFPSLTASGRVESSKRTLIECELENISIGVMGQRLSAGGASLLLDIVPEGTNVSKGDVLAVLDASEYEELVRQQRMTVERSRADHHQAELNLEIAKMAVHEFREGSMKEVEKDSRRRVALAESDLVRINDHLRWSRRMKSKGYASIAQVTEDEFRQARANFALEQERNSYQLFTEWSAPKSLKVLEGRVLGYQATLEYQANRLNRNLDRLKKLELQVERCTIRAPHDGFVIYAKDERRNIQIEPGMSVRQRQDLMYLPDLRQMEVVTSLHESIVKAVEKGMRAQVIVEGLPGRKIEGHVNQVADLPTFDWRSDVRYFDGKVKLDNPPEGILPGMTAHVEIALDRKEQVLAVPTNAVAHEGGRQICYVVRDDGLERREVRLGDGTSDLLEISEGLKEGEQVVVNPVLAEVTEDITEETCLLAAQPVKADDLPEELQPASTDESAPAQDVAALR